MELIDDTDSPSILALDVRNTDRYIDCQKKVYEWVYWYKEVKTINEEK